MRAARPLVNFRVGFGAGELCRWFTNKCRSCNRQPRMGALDWILLSLFLYPYASNFPFRSYGFSGLGVVIPNRIQRESCSRVCV